MDSILQVIAATTKTKASTTSGSSDGAGVFWFIVIAIAVIWIIKKVAESSSNTNNKNYPNSTYPRVQSNNENIKHVNVWDGQRIKTITAPVTKEPEKKPLTIKKTTGLKSEVTEIDSIALGPEQKRVYDKMNGTHENLFITGKAGTGKSVLLQYFVRHTSKQVAVVAPTGVAALNVGGQTIHSFFGMGFDIQDPDDISQVSDMGYKKREILNGLQVLVIDEISMVSADIMDMIDAKLKYARNNQQPFGGCQIIAFGDLYQLPPVVPSGQATRYMEDRYTTTYFFGADEIRNHPFEIIELQHVFRQKDPVFIDILNQIRLGKTSKAVLDDINSCCVLPPEDEKYITLTGDNATANRINREKLDALPSKEFIYTGKVTGDLKQSSMPTDLNLHLKVGAHVMMIKNDRTDNTSNDKRKKARWVNGTLGVISQLTDNGIKVEINGVSHWVDKEVWEKYQYSYDASTKSLNKDVVATFSQYPIKLAYAITIHKSQGQTYDAVKVDLTKGAFAAGQTYVALSRCRSMSSLYLTSALKQEDIKVSQEVVNYMKGRIVEPSEKTDLYKIKNVRQRSDNWFEMRQGKVTGTTAYYLKYHSVSFAIQKGAEEEDRDYTNDAMQRGRELEPIGIAKFAKTKNLKVESAGFVDSLVHEDAGFSPDGVIYDSDGKIKTIIEHKAFGEKHHLACYDCIDDRVMYQIQFGLFVTGAKDAYLVLYNPDLYDTRKQLLIKHVEKDDKIQEIFESRFEEHENGEEDLTENSIRVKRPSSMGEEVLQYDDDGKIIAEYASLAEASEKANLSYTSIRDVVRGRQKHAGGYGWIYKKDYSGDKRDLIKRSTNKRPAMNPVSILQCDDEGNVIAEFESISQADRETTASRTGISNVLRGAQTHAGGYVWKYKE